MHRKRWGDFGDTVMDLALGDLRALGMPPFERRPQKQSQKIRMLQQTFCKTFSSSYYLESSTVTHWNISKPFKCADTATAICTVLQFYFVPWSCCSRQSGSADTTKSISGTLQRVPPMFRCKLSFNSLDRFIDFKNIAQLLGMHQTNPNNLKDYNGFKVQGPNCYSKCGSTQDVCIGKSLNLSRVITWLVSRFFEYLQNMLCEYSSDF